MKKKHLLPLNLQLFAEGDDNPEITPPAFNVDELTDEQLASIREKHGLKTDDDVNEIIKGKHAKWNKDQQAKENRAKELSELSEEQREQAILQIEKDELKKEKEEFRKEQLLVEKGKQLLAVGIPSRHASRIKGETAEEILADIKEYKDTWDEDLADAVDKRLKGSVFTPGGVSGNKGDNKGSIGKRLAEQNKESRSKTNPYFKEN